MARPRSDIGNIQYRDVKLHSDDQGRLSGTIIHFHQPEETQLKSCTVGIANDVHHLSRCDSQYIHTTNSNCAQTLPVDRKLFLGYIEHSSKVCSARSTTVTNWVKEIMQIAGIDTTLYGPHSIRSTASTKAIERGHTIEEVKEHDNWSSNTQTFEHFYYKPTTKASLGSRITNSIFTVENLTTLEAGAEATEIVTGTTNNQNVAEAKAENVINAHPTTDSSWLNQLNNLLILH